MNYLAVDTSNKNLTVVLNYNGKLIKYFNGDCGVNHSVEIMPAIEKVILDANADLKDVDFFACVIGPGSFTGIRIGVATVKALCLAYNKPSLAITSFDTIAYNNLEKSQFAVIDAKHNCYYACGYNKGEVIFEPAYLTKEKLLEISLASEITSFEQLKGLENKVYNVVDGLINAIEHKKHLLTNANNLVPLYVRKSQAEEGR
ncbi:MAG: tRNA (adenosine(37)-N6)-threonylcarbamoyltransferase complex dimerization subunit type 1 TsaB [Clostridia bacterium]|nr:tRNA (adenosine(37)-N6)-threonylcarbamoyltransferase complex dimerization subunit type 1 TsaB [Clostridia bacterium]